MNWRSALGVAALALTICCSAWGFQPLGYDAMMAELKAAAITGRVRVARVGSSVANRPIPLVIIGPDDASTRVLVLCRQHGNEPVSTEAAMRVVRRAAGGNRALQRSLNDVQMLILPMINPDGAQKFRRVNANGVDLNRDWLRRSQPETRAVEAVFSRLAPQVVLDEHEWTNDDSCGSDSLEATGAANRLAHTIQRGSLSAGDDVGVPIRPGYYSGSSDPRLAHRHFQRKGASAFLLETTPSVPADSRLALYERMIVRVGHVAALHSVSRVAPGRASEYPDMFAAPAPVRSAQSHLPVMGIAALFALTLVVTSVFGADQKKSEIRQASPLRRVPLGQVGDLSARFKRRYANASSRATSAG